jgi:acetyl esterase/lipase
VVLSGGSAGAQLYRDLSPISQITAEAPPFLLVHGARDTLAPIAGARAFAETFAEKATSTIHLLEFPCAQHAFDIFPSQHALAAVEAASRFCQHQNKRSQRVKPN